MNNTYHASGLTGIHNRLYAPPGPLLKQDTVFRKHYQAHGCSISLRPVCILTDLPVIYNWAWKQSEGAGLIAASYLYARDSCFARSFMVMLNNNLPACQVDICRVTQDDLCSFYKAQPGDFVIRLLTNPRTTIRREWQRLIIKACLEYFFSFREVERLLCDPEEENSLQQALLEQTGFRFRQKIWQPYKEARLYCCTRQSFKAAGSPACASQ
jgi:hypothetical protein